MLHKIPRRLRLSATCSQLPFFRSVLVLLFFRHFHTLPLSFLCCMPFCRCVHSPFSYSKVNGFKYGASSVYVEIYVFFCPHSSLNITTTHPKMKTLPSKFPPIPQYRIPERTGTPSTGRKILRFFLLGWIKLKCSINNATLKLTAIRSYIFLL